MSRKIAKFWRDFIPVRIHVAPVFTPTRTQEKSPGELFLFWFRAKGVVTIGAKMITCRKNVFEQLIFELHRITVHPFLFARINFRL